MHDVRNQFLPLLDYIEARDYPRIGRYEEWCLNRVSGGSNNLLYRASNNGLQIAIKFVTPGKRDRAGREYGALSALQHSGLSIAPIPLLLDRDRYRYPVVVQSWLEGKVDGTPPNRTTDWTKLVEHFALTHSLTPDSGAGCVQPPVLTMDSADSGKQRIRQEVALMPVDHRPAQMLHMLEILERVATPDWQQPSRTLCRCDPNISNFVRRPDTWASVDWENSGWGDPAFEITDLMSHPMYAGVRSSRWDWVIDTYCRLRSDEEARIRIRTYYLLMTGWWIARFARTLYEVPRGLDSRLVPRPDGWQVHVQTNYSLYTARLECLLSRGALKALKRGRRSSPTADAARRPHE